MANPITSSAFQRLFDTRIREVFENVWTDLTKSESRIEDLYRILPSDSNMEEFYGVGAVPDLQEFT